MLDKQWEDILFGNGRKSQINNEDVRKVLAELKT